MFPLNRSCGFLGAWQPLESQFVVVYAYFTRAAPHGISQGDSSKHVSQHFKWPMKGRRWGALQAVTSNPAFPLGRTWTHTEEFIWMQGKNHQELDWLRIPWKIIKIQWCSGFIPKIQSVLPQYLLYFNTYTLFSLQLSSHPHFTFTSFYLLGMD